MKYNSNNFLRNVEQMGNNIQIGRYLAVTSTPVSIKCIKKVVLALERHKSACTSSSSAPKLSDILAVQFLIPLCVLFLTIVESGKNRK